jgi:hypothetical protein
VPRPRRLLGFVYPSAVLVLFSFCFLFFLFFRYSSVIGNVIDNADTNHDEALMSYLYNVKNKPILSTDFQTQCYICDSSLLISV